MKTKSLLLVSSFIVLYIAPMIFAPSYISPTILTEQNMSKEFQVSDGEGWLEGWAYRQSALIVAGDPALNYQVRIPVTYNSLMQSDFDDIRFTENTGRFLLDYWCESYIDSTSAVFWVEIDEELDLDYTIYMYYGNSTVSSASNGTETFLVFEDWASESVRTDVWDIVTATGSVSYSAVGATHGTIAKIEGNAGVAYRITSDYDSDSPIAVMFRSYIEEATTGNTARQGSGYDGAFAFTLVQTTVTGEVFYVYDDLGNQDSQAMTLDYFDAWVTFQITRDGTNAKLYADDVLIETASCQPDNVDTNPATSIMVGDSEDDLYSDWVAVRQFRANEPTFSSFGAIEGQEWYEIGEATLYFIVPFDYWAFNMFMLFFGLILVIASGCYLAYSIKNNMSQDKFFYFLIAFFMGWGLFLGGMLI